MSQLWTQGGRLIRSSGRLVRCDDCPCGDVNCPPEGAVYITLTGIQPGDNVTFSAGPNGTYEVPFLFGSTNWFRYETQISGGVDLIDDGGNPQTQLNLRVLVWKLEPFCRVYQAGAGAGASFTALFFTQGALPSSFLDEPIANTNDIDDLGYQGTATVSANAPAP